MHLTAEQVSNLCLLADFMEGLDDPKFDMKRYFHADCCTPSCAFGWACTMPGLKQMGLSRAKSETIFGPYHFQLFGGSLCDEIHTPQQWAAHCRAFLKENGYDITKDPFKIFMQKALEPVEEGQLGTFERTS